MSRRFRKSLGMAVKVAVGSSVAIWIAETMQLEYAAAAGGVALLTIMGTKWNTVRLSLQRIVTFFASVCLMWLATFIFHNDMVEYGIFVFFLVLVCLMLGWSAAISVNAVIATHFMTGLDYSTKSIWNEFLIVLIGITVAIIVNLFNNNYGNKKEQIRHMREIEQEMKKILLGMADYLSGREAVMSVWDRATVLERTLSEYIRQAQEYQDNTFSSHPGYYIDYFEMRKKQCIVLHNLHYEMRRIRTMPRQAHIISDYILYMAEYVVEVNIPEKQLTRLEEIFDSMRKQPLPSTHDDFESRAILYHILMDLEEFLFHKKKFVENMDETQMKVYWEKA